MIQNAQDPFKRYDNVGSNEQQCVQIEFLWGQDSHQSERGVRTWPFSKETTFNNPICDNVTHMVALTNFCRQLTRTVIIISWIVVVTSKRFLTETTHNLGLFYFIVN